MIIVVIIAAIIAAVVLKKKMAAVRLKKEWSAHWDKVAAFMNDFKKKHGLEHEKHKHAIEYFLKVNGPSGSYQGYEHPELTVYKDIKKILYSTRGRVNSDDYLHPRIFSVNDIYDIQFKTSRFDSGKVFKIQVVLKLTLPDLPEVRYIPFDFTHHPASITQSNGQHSDYKRALDMVDKLVKVLREMDSSIQVSNFANKNEDVQPETTEYERTMELLDKVSTKEMEEKKGKLQEPIEDQRKAWALSAEQARRFGDDREKVRHYDDLLGRSKKDREDEDKKWDYYKDTKNRDGGINF
ncbi:hypothetical protein SFC55_26105 [Niallia taxi]|uniref:hypothetical protein n=1 Tax=Niallia taxi TaxID=2499688 RepID=UPI0039819D18